MTATADQAHVGMNRADALLLALELRNTIVPDLPKAPSLKGLLTILAEQVGSIGRHYRQWFRQALLDRALIETLAYLDVNGLIDNEFRITELGLTRLQEPRLQGRAAEAFSRWSNPSGGHSPQTL